jgi:hypothetical protein
MVPAVVAIDDNWLLHLPRFSVAIFLAKAVIPGMINICAA